MRSAMKATQLRHRRKEIASETLRTGRSTTRSRLSLDGLANCVRRRSQKRHADSRACSANRLPALHEAKELLRRQEMKAIRSHEFDDADVLHLEEVEKPDTAL